VMSGARYSYWIALVFAVIYALAVWTGRLL
jgi:hypothetical protein